MIRSSAFERLARAALALLALAVVTSCGSGGVNGPVPVNDPTRITILPAGTVLAPVTAYSGLPTTFTLSGGTGSYIVSSDNQAAIQVAGAINGTTLTVTPNPVLADTTVTITVRDTGTAPTASTVITVKPGTVNNSITVTPTAPNTCDPNLCAGGDAIVSATIAQGGIPLAARSVRFDVVSGDFAFVNVDPVTLNTSLSTSTTVTTDETGKAQARLRASAGAASQTALLQVTDVGTGTFQRTSFVIAQSTGAEPGFLTVPSSITFQGAVKDQCADRNGVAAHVLVFGGVPPYTVASTTTAFLVSPGNLSVSGGSFDVTPAGICVDSPGLPVVVQDSAGHTTQTLVSNLAGTVAAPTLTVAPSSVTLTSCTGTANVTVAGGAPINGNYFATSGSDALLVTLVKNTVTIRRANPSQGSTTDVNVGVSDGTSTANVTVHLIGEGAGNCPAIRTAPSTVVLSDCTTHVAVALSGGTLPYSISSSSAAVTASPTSSSTFDVFRTSGSSGLSGTATITVIDSSNPHLVGSVSVTGSGAGAASCP